MGARQDFSFRTSKRGTASKVTFTGPFFEKDPSDTLRVNIRAMLQGMADEGEGAVQAILAPHNRSGALSGSIHGRTKSLTGKPWALHAVISSNLNEVIAKSRGQASGQWHGSYAGYIETGLRVNDRIKIGTRVNAKGRTVGVWQRRVVAGGGNFHGIRMFRSVSAGLRVRQADLAKGLT